MELCKNKMQTDLKYDEDQNAMVGFFKKWKKKMYQMNDNGKRQK